MAFKDFPEMKQGIELLQRSLQRGRLGHAYLFSGVRLDELEGVAESLAKTLNCLNPLRAEGRAVDCCDECLNCRKINDGNHGDVFWVRAESKLREIRIHQITRRKESPARVVLEFINLKPTESEYKVCAIVGADRMTEEAANSFLKTLEEPSPKSVLILLTTESERILETIRSRCLRLNFGIEGRARFSAEQVQWLKGFAALAGENQKSLIGRYRLVEPLAAKLAELKSRVEEDLTAKSPLEQFPDADEKLREKWEKELAAAIESEYRQQRGEFLLILQWWLRDVWLHTLQTERELLNFPDLNGAGRVAQRIAPAKALENLQIIETTQRLLHTNVQEALALEVGLLKLNL